MMKFIPFHVICSKSFEKKVHLLLEISCNQCCCCVGLSCKGLCNQFCCCTDLLLVVINLKSFGVSKESRMLHNQIYCGKRLHSQHYVDLTS